MSILGAVIVPHPPLIIPTVGHGREQEVQSTIDAYQTAAKQVAAWEPEVLIITSPHQKMYSDYFHISPGRGTIGDMAAFGAGQTKMVVEYDAPLRDEIIRRAESADLRVGTLGQRNPYLDHGTFVPLYFLREAGVDCPILRIGLSRFSPLDHYRLGQCIAQAVDAQGREFASIPVSIGVIENLVLMLTADPEKLHVDETAEVGLPVEHGAPSAVAWSLTCGGEEIPVSLENDGGTLSFEETGAYVLTATATDELGKVFTETATLEVWPLIDLTLDMPEAIPVDQSASVSLHGTDLSVMWKVTAEDGTVFTPALYKEGGEITFPAVGTYTVTASVTDELGSTFHASGAIQVWDTMQLAFRLPEFVHPDETVKVKMASEHLGQSKIAWSLTVDGKPVRLTDGIKGSLDNDGGSLKFKRTGTNAQTASVTDGLGRTFTYEQTIEVYPALTLDLAADRAVHTDEPICSRYCIEKCFRH